uniref:PDZ domain-containing protein n=1 Tax=Labrus bergylta TaxID=56723 RepID=A0A3Q3FJB0_9LABR
MPDGKQNGRKDYLAAFQSERLFRKPGKSLGISIVGGRGMGSRLSNGEVMRGIFIKHILEDSPAGQNGTLKTGDRIVEVKEEDTESIDLYRFPTSFSVPLSSTYSPLFLLLLFTPRWPLIKFCLNDSAIVLNICHVVSLLVLLCVAFRSRPCPF